MNHQRDGTLPMDGVAHSSREAEDMERDEWLKANAGYKAILHFPNKTPSDKVVAGVLNYRKEFA